MANLLFDHLMQQFLLNLQEIGSTFLRSGVLEKPDTKVSGFVVFGQGMDALFLKSSDQGKNVGEQ